MTSEENTNTSRRVPCICGALLVLIDTHTDYPGWSHYTYGHGGCMDPVPAAGMPTKEDRTDLANRMRTTGRQLNRIGTELADIKSRAKEIVARLEALDQPSPESIRRATLNQVWDRLLDANQLAAAALVMRMVGNMNEGDWS